MLTQQQDRMSSGIVGLDEILHGGFVPGRSYLLTGPPGTGKTTVGWHFLTAPPAAPSLFVTFGQPESELREDARKQGFDLQNVHFLDVSPSAKSFEHVEHYDVFSPAEVEREPLVRSVVDTIASVKPHRIFIDSMSYLRAVSSGESQFRKQTLAFLRYLTAEGAVVLMSRSPAGFRPTTTFVFSPAE